MNKKFKNRVLSLLILILASFVFFTYEINETKNTKADRRRNIERSEEKNSQDDKKEEVFSEKQVVNSEIHDYILVTSIVDGDTIELETGEKVRYIGIDTPESVHPTKKVQCFGKEAAAKNTELALNKRVRLEKDVSETDRYKRLLRYVYLEDGTFINLELVKQGYAQAYTYPPDVKHVEEFKQAQQEAREGKRGLWGKCN